MVGYIQNVLARGGVPQRLTVSCVDRAGVQCKFTQLEFDYAGKRFRREETFHSADYLAAWDAFECYWLPRGGLPSPPSQRRN